MDSVDVARRRRRVAVAGPLASFADGLRAELASQGYAQDTVVDHVHLLADLSLWLLGQGMTVSDLTTQMAQEFLDAARWRVPRRSDRPRDHAFAGLSTQAAGHSTTPGRFGDHAVGDASCRVSPLPGRRAWSVSGNGHPLSALRTNVSGIASGSGHHGDGESVGRAGDRLCAGVGGDAAR